VDAQVRGMDLVPALGAVAQAVHDAFRVQVCFVQILQRRWSFLVGRASDEPLPSQPTRIPLAGGIGLVCTDWGTLSAADRDRFVTFLNDLIAMGREGTSHRPAGVP
jgi:hypothetical protein